MPRSNDPEHYPDFFTEFVTGCALAGKTFRVPASGPLTDDPPDPLTGEVLTGMKKALKIRGLFYAYIGSLKKARAREEKGLAEPKWTEIATYASKTIFFIDKEKIAIYFYPRTQSWQNKVLASGGEVDGGTALPSSAAEESLRRLQEQLKEDFEP